MTSTPSCEPTRFLLKSLFQHDLHARMTTAQRLLPAADAVLLAAPPQLEEPNLRRVQGCRHKPAKKDQIRIYLPHALIRIHALAATSGARCGRFEFNLASWATF